MNDNSSQTSPFNRREERLQTRLGYRGRGWIWGILLILLAVILLLQNLNIYSVHNWWSLFILIPALGSFATAWRMVQEAGGRFTENARSAFIVGGLLSLVTAMFLFELSWTFFGPIFLVLAGIGLIANALLSK